MSDSTKRYTIFAIVALSLLAFFPVLSAGFVNYDDPEYVLNNPYIRQFTGENLRQIFFGRTTDLYVPLTLFSYLLEHSLFGESAKASHAINLLLHILNAILLFRLLLRLGLKDQGLLWLILVFFTLSPLVTESVCWITERKDVLYSLFYLLSLLRFLRYRDSGQARHLLLCFLLFLLSCLSKPMAVSLPVLLSLYLLFQNKGPNWKGQLVLVPFYLVSVLFSVISVLSLSTLGPIKASIAHYNIAEKLLLVPAELGYYFAKPFMPVEQSLFHAFPKEGTLLSERTVIGYALVFAGLAALVAFRALKRNDRPMLFLFLAWLAFLAPVLQIYSNTHSYVSERYFYLSIVFPVCLVFLLLKAGGIAEKTIRYAALLLLLLFIPLTYKRSQAWKNSKTLFEAELKTDPQNPQALNNLGYHYNSISDFARAVPLLARAVALDSSNALSLNNYGWALANLGQADDAQRHFKKALVADPKYLDAWNNLGVSYMQRRQPEAAAQCFKNAYALNPRHPDVLFNLGLYYYKSGNADLGLPMLRQSYELGNKKALKYLNR